MTPHRYRIYIKATPEEVWQGIIDPAFTRQYFHGTAFDEAPQAGQPYRTTMGNGMGAVDGTIEVCEPPHKLVQTWHVLYDAAMAEEPASRVEWTITPAGDGLTQLDVVHGDLARSPLTWAGVQHGWVWILDGLKTLLETGAVLPAATAEEAGAPTADEVRGAWHRAQGIECNNSVWELIEQAERTPADDEEMLRRAYASAYHWQRAKGRGPENEARAVWMLSKVHLLVGLPERALHYGGKCLAQCTQHGLADFDLAYALECRARALKALGRDQEAADEWARALAVPIADPEDKAILEADLAVGP
ncbi:MAG: SRPBCC family protein [Actinomycetota bacterium]|nr:SRPBCC family protein [Actinomycetota bacterium]